MSSKKPAAVSHAHAAHAGPVPDAALGHDLPAFVIQTSGQPADLTRLERAEWLLTNALGGFAMGTALSAPSRRYHGLLISSQRPPVRRLMALNAVSITLVLRPGTGDETVFDLSTFRFRPGEYHPQGFTHLRKFEKSGGVSWTWQCGSVELTKTLALAHERNSAGVSFSIRTTDNSVVAARLVLRPLVSLRDFHALNLRDTRRDWFRTDVRAERLQCAVQSPMGELFLSLDAPGLKAGIKHEEHWWYNFQLERERERGYDFLEDLFHPATFEVAVDASSHPSVATLSASCDVPSVVDVPAALAEKSRRLAKLASATLAPLNAPAVAATMDAPTRRGLTALAIATDDFIVRRAPPPAPGTSGMERWNGSLEGGGVSILAGFPWFADWGRDAMIALPGLLLASRRFEEAEKVLRTFAAARGPRGKGTGGLIPNLFDDYTGEAHYNTVDASLWFVQASCAFLRMASPGAAARRELLDACLDIIGAYREGTDFGIAMDPADGLIIAGNHTTQLTWMDAARDGVVFTPRFGKPVEVNALWHSALASVAMAIRPELDGLADEFDMLRLRVADSFTRAFWNPARGCLFDCLVPDHEQAHLRPAHWTPSPEVRPNQLFAVSLEHSPLSTAQKRSILKIVHDELFTPLGLRTLERADGRYRGRFRGRMFDRDAAYHNGTAWPWLLGPFAEGLLRAGEFSDSARAQARAALAPALSRLDKDCLGTLAEVFDGDDTTAEPQEPGGCPAQAWSVAEVLRVSLLAWGAK
ncbi:MAG: amylo-alpha-1,6-glucosidase [Planctomyces sp.]